jgi:hypothetical protein
VTTDVRQSIETSLTSTVGRIWKMGLVYGISNEQLEPDQKMVHYFVYHPRTVLEVPGKE